MWNFMTTPENMKDVMVKSNKEGVDKVTIFKLYNFKILFFVYWGIEQVKREKGGYAFMMESASIQYIIERECDLGQCFTYTDKKENQIFLIYKGIQKGALAKSYMTKGLLMYD